LASIIFPGFPEGISWQEFSERVTQQARRFGVEILQAGDVEKLEMEAGYHEVYTSDGKHYHSHAVLVTTGASYRRLDVPGEDDYIGAGLARLSAAYDLHHTTILSNGS
jgi:thioredoxin reductase (NADPH)